MSRTPSCPAVVSACTETTVSYRARVQITTIVGSADVRAVLANPDFVGTRRDGRHGRRVAAGHGRPLLRHPRRADLAAAHGGLERDGHLAFGAGPRACPGSVHALALAAGVVDAVRDGRLVGHEVRYEPRSNLRIPARPVVSVR